MTDVVIPEENLSELSSMNRWTDSELRSLSKAENPFQAALDSVKELYGDVQDISEHLGNGFSLCDDKSKLVGKRMVIISVGINSGNFGLFVTMAVATEDGKLLIVNDGSTGIRDQVKDLIQTTGRWGGWEVSKGLRVSRYEYVDEKGNEIPAETYYIDTSSE